MPRPHTIAQLPRVIPIFPLANVLLLPHGKLPLNIFEPRYLAMTRAALADHWTIGMVQPVDPNGHDDKPEVYRVGCAGRITSLNETDDGRYIITLSGLARFEIEEELALCDGFRQVSVSWRRYGHDLGEEDPEQVERERLLPALKSYFEVQGLKADWKAIDDASNDQLVISLAMICPFEAREKQALLEAPDLRARSELLISLLAMAVLDHGENANAFRN